MEQINPYDLGHVAQRRRALEQQPVTELYEECYEERERLQQELAECRAENERLREAGNALRRYLKHEIGCEAISTKNHEPCTCGAEKALDDWCKLLSL